MSAPQINQDDAAVIASIFDRLEGLNVGPKGADYYLTTHDTDGVRLWHSDGYSPGYFELVDEFWMFVVNEETAS